MRAPRHRSAYITLLLLAHLIGTCADLLATAVLQQCVDNGSTDPALAGLHCKQEITVSVTLFGGQAAGTERIEANITSVTTVNGAQVKLSEPIVIAYVKSVPLLVFPVNYKVSVNNKPTETIIKTDSLCVDAYNALNPTCGWYYAENQQVPDSQGYCCTCSLLQILKINNEPTRAGLTCDFELTFPSFSQSSAHCLTFDDLWWDVFEIGDSGATASEYFSIDVGVAKYSSSQGKWVSQSIQLGPTKPSGISTDGTVVAKLVGNFAPYTQFPVLSDKFLLIPSRPANNPLVQGGLANAMLIDKYLCDLDGYTCNKIGVSFSGFRSEPQACSNLPGNCLHNQPADYYAQDRAKMAAGHKGDYILSNYGEAQILTSASDQPPQVVLAFKITESVDVSLVTLTFPADDIAFVQNSCALLLASSVRPASPGNITDAHIQTFEAQSKDGLLLATVVNTGTLIADYSVTVENCSFSILPVEAKKVSLAPSQPATLSFNIYSDVQIGLTSHCTVGLYDSQGDLVSTYLVIFNTTQTNISRGAQGGVPPVRTPAPAPLPIIGDMTCAVTCPNLCVL